MNKSSFFYALVCVFFGILASLLVSEALLRFMVSSGVLKPGSRYVSILKDVQKDSLCRKSKDPILGFEFIPHSRQGFIHINADGFRGKEFSRSVPPGVTRVAILGDSESVGLLLRQEDTLSGELTTAFAAAAGKGKYEVLDFGFPGYNIQQKARILANHALPYHPQIVILYYVFNDPLPYANTELIAPSPFLKSYLYIFLKYYRTLHQTSNFQWAHQNRSFVNYFQTLHASAEFEDCKNWIKRMGRVLHEMQIRFIVVIAPEMICYDDFKSYPYKNIHEKLKDLSSPEVEVVDPLPDLAASGNKPTDLWVSPYDCHKGKTANAIIAKSISTYILRSRPPELH